MPDLSNLVLRLLTHYRSLTLPDYILIVVLALAISAVIHRFYSLGFRVKGETISTYKELRTALLQRIDELTANYDKAQARLQAMQSQHTEVKASAETLAHNIGVIRKAYASLYLYMLQLGFLLDISLLLTFYMDAPKSSELRREIAEYIREGVAEVKAFGFFLTDSLPNATSSKIEMPQLRESTVTPTTGRRILAAINEMSRYLDKDKGTDK